MTMHYRSFPPKLADIIATTDLTVAGRNTGGIYRKKLKRAMDLTAILLAAPFILPIILVLALLVASNGGKPFYFQNRIGRGGQVYRIWKLRSMVANADEALKAYLDSSPEAAAEWNSTQKLKNDPRVTWFGRILRKTSLDELPQLFNVLKGDMSLIGPRPMMQQQKELYPGRAYYDLRPGITGYWQISDRNESTFAERAFYDTRYNADLSFKTDMKILMATVGVVWRGTGY